VKHYERNPLWLLWFAPFRSLSISAAYLVPFFVERGLSAAEIMGLQALFSLLVVFWQLPSGWFADRFGRAFSIKLGVPLLAVGFIAYGLSDSWWQFALCEVVLAIGNGFISGADQALLHDSLEAMGRQSEFERYVKRINALGYLSVALAFPVSLALISSFGVAATVIADGLLVVVGGLFVWRLVEAPSFGKGQGAKVWESIQALKEVSSRAEVRWLLVLTMALSAATYMGSWFSAPAYESMGLPLSVFAAVLAVRSLWKAGWSQFYHPKKAAEAHMLSYAGLSVLAFLAMASGHWWWLWLVLGHDVVQALQGPAILQRLNGHVSHNGHRATLNSAVSMLQRLAYAGVGYAAGLFADHGGLAMGLLFSGVLCGGAAFFALARLHRLGTFRGQR
jgi:MFS family permease